jgi:dephospho-CoA kinase
MNQPATSNQPRDSRRPLVIGLVGGIGSGKSFVASCFAQLGCLISDSDAEVRQLLATPSIAAELATWWGPGVLLPDGAANRKAIADIVFTDPANRVRLEQFIHPKLKLAREALIASARDRGVAAVVIDAPLLLEAGLAPECDALIFVDATLEQRRTRVAKRGWSEQELDRREAAQMPLQEKRARCGYIVTSDDSAVATRQQVTRIFDELLSRFA